MKKASSMIELVIAIVVMGIAVMTLPLMLERNQENNAFAMQQETILAARTEIGDILTYPWDENSIKDNVVGVVDVVNGDSELDRNTTQRRIGHIRQDKRRKLFSDETNASLTSTFDYTADGDIIPDDIDDFNGDKSYDSITSSLSYRFKFDINTTVAYVSDTTNYTLNNINFNFNTNTANLSTNIKMIELNVSNTENSITPFTLRAYSANIGGNQLLRRDW